MTTSLYDPDGRLVSETWYNAQDKVVNTESFTYDADGNMLTAQNDSGTYTMTYDASTALSRRKTHSVSRSPTPMMPTATGSRSKTRWAA